MANDNIYGNCYHCHQGKYFQSRCQYFPIKSHFFCILLAVLQFAKYKTLFEIGLLQLIKLDGPHRLLPPSKQRRVSDHWIWSNLSTFHCPDIFFNTSFKQKCKAIWKTSRSFSFTSLWNENWLVKLLINILDGIFQKKLLSLIMIRYRIIISW